jgi:sugar lactone lactonase YvrE
VISARAFTCIGGLFAIVATTSCVCSKPQFDKNENDHPPPPDAAEPEPSKAQLMVETDMPRGFTVDTDSLYWFEESSLKKMPTGFGEQSTLCDGIEPGQGPVVAGNYVYWAVPEDDQIKIVSVSRNGGMATKVALTKPRVRDLEGDQTGVYWTSCPGDCSAGADGSILHVAVGEQPKTIAAKLVRPNLLAIDSGQLYFTALDAATITRVAKGGGPTAIVEAEKKWTPAIAASGRWIWWLNGSAIMRVAKNGGTSKEMAKEDDPPVAFAADADGVVWATADGRIKRMDDDSAKSRTVAKDQGFIADVATNGRAVFWQTKSSIRMAQK